MVKLSQTWSNVLQTCIIWCGSLQINTKSRYFDLGMSKLTKIDAHFFYLTPLWKEASLLVRGQKSGRHYYCLTSYQYQVFQKLKRGLEEVFSKSDHHKKGSEFNILQF